MTLLRDKAKRNVIRTALYDRLNGAGVSISETVSTLRKILAQDQATFSVQSGVSLSTLRKIEQEGGSVSLATLRKILDRFSLEIVVRAKPRTAKK